MAMTVVCCLRFEFDVNLTYDPHFISRSTQADCSLNQNGKLLHTASLETVYY